MLLEDAVFYSHRCAINKRVGQSGARKDGDMQTPAKVYVRYLRQLGKHKETASMEGRGVTEVRRAADELSAIGDAVYAGTRSGDVYVFTGALEKLEVFRVASSGVNRIFRSGDSLVASTVDGHLVSFRDRVGTACRITGSNMFNVTPHPYLPICFLNTETSLLVYDFEANKILLDKPMHRDLPISSISIGHDGACLFLGCGRGSLIDIRNMEPCFTLPHGCISSAYLHSDSISLIAADRGSHMSTWDIRAQRKIVSVPTRGRVLKVKEYRGAIGVSTASTYLQVFCAYSGIPLKEIALDSSIASIETRGDALYASTHNKKIRSYAPRHLPERSADRTTS